MKSLLLVCLCAAAPDSQTYSVAPSGVLDYSTIQRALDAAPAGATISTRDPHAKQLTAAEAARYEPRLILADDDHWDPTK